MNLALAIALYFICWWIVLFAMLPIGVRSQDEDGEVTPGTERGAPSAPRLLAKALATTVVSGAIFAGFYWLYVHSGIALDDIPFLPRFEAHR